MLQQYRMELLKMIQKARDTENHLALTDTTEADFDDGEHAPTIVTFKTLKEILEEALVNLEEESNHVHDYKTENGMCSGCGADGNA